MSVEPQVTWNYSKLARSYLKRPEYSEGGLDAMLAISKPQAGGTICDIGAGIGHLTIPLARRGFTVTAVEPNDEMRALGQERTREISAITWRKGTGEDNGAESGAFDFISFGSSFNVTNRDLALRETHRVLRSGGWFACMWNHRNLDDPLQKEVEGIIKSFIPDYDYGTRREDQTQVILNSGLFETPYRIEAPVVHRVGVGDWVEAWRSHATLDRQSNGRLHEIVDAIAAHLANLGPQEITVPYTTRIWVARAKA